MDIARSHYTTKILRCSKGNHLAKIVSITKGAKIVASMERIYVEPKTRKGKGKTMINRMEYCKDCDRSIYATGDLARSCDSNIADNGYYNLAGEKCYCKIVNGERAEKYPWEETKGDKTE